MGTDNNHSLSNAEYDRRMQRPQKDFEVFLDMDGVLSDFDKHARDHGKFDAKGQPKWDELDFGWWSTMPAFDGMKKFYEDMKEFGNVRMLTSPTLSTDCFHGKAEWVKGQWGKWGLRDLIICRAQDKQFLARPNHILVDDRQKNIDEWTAAGGIGILHKGDYADTLARVRTAAAAFLNAAPPRPAKPADKPPAP
jgi:hypothetical protein